MLIEALTALQATIAPRNIQARVKDKAEDAARSIPEGTEAAAAGYTASLPLVSPAALWAPPAPHHSELRLTEQHCAPAVVRDLPHGQVPAPQAGDKGISSAPVHNSAGHAEAGAGWSGDNHAAGEQVALFCTRSWYDTCSALLTLHNIWLASALSSKSALQT